jgi:RNA polymerase sigma factor (TIGR02999 family)
MESNDLTLLLASWAQGDPSAIEKLTVIVYPELRRIAAACLRQYHRGNTLQPTSLVSELFLKLLSDPPGHFENRRRFYALAARMMRNALVDHYREGLAQKRATSQSRVPFHDEISWVNVTGPELLDFDRALDELSEFDPLLAELVQLRFVLGCTAEETATLVGTSKATVDRKVRLGRAWIFRRLGFSDDSVSAVESI